MIVSANHLYDFTLALTFSTGEKKIIDLLPLFSKYVKGDNIKFFSPVKFQKFIVKRGNIYWGKNEEVIFPVDMLYFDETNNIGEEVLYII